MQGFVKEPRERHKYYINIIGGKKIMYIEINTNITYESKPTFNSVPQDILDRSMTRSRHGAVVLAVKTGF